MGEVYRAFDPRLGREVAVKVLPADVGSDPEGLSRFEREARAVAALNHPNLLTVFDVGLHRPADTPSTPSAPYVVTELLEGETLREMSRGEPPRSARSSPSQCRWRTVSTPPTRRASSTGTSSPRTCS
jgi:serine/threonine protein kinase